MRDPRIGLVDAYQQYEISTSAGTRQNPILIIDEDDENDNVEDKFATPSSDVFCYHCHHCRHVYYDCVEYQCDNCHVYAPGHQFRTATTLIIVEAGVFNHSKGVMLRWPHFCCIIPFSNMQHPHVRYPMICHPRLQTHAFTRSVTLVLASCIPHVVHFVTRCFP